MARRYDPRTTIFSPEGRLYQVEYAMEAIAHSTACLGIVADDGILLAGECRNTNKLLHETNRAERMFILNEDMACSVSGVSSDAHILTNELFSIVQRYLINYGETMPTEQLVSYMCDLKQAYTQYGGKRPFGVSILYMGWDEHHGYQLYQSDPTGNYSGWKATCIGQNANAAISIMKEELSNTDIITLEDAKDLAIKVLSKILDTEKLTADMVEITTLERIDDETQIDTLTESDIEELIEKYNNPKDDSEAAEEEEEEEETA